jgi:redox-sensitive bicupin YhaK (pirin superfamily)
MSIRITPVVAGRTQAGTRTDFVKTVQVPPLGDVAAPIASLAHYVVTAPMVGPRLEPGLSSVTYVLRNSQAGMRSRDSLGNDLVMRPGGLVWTQGRCGIAHEHLPAEFGRELSCLQLHVHPGFTRTGPVHLVHRVEPEQVPEWRSGSGDCVRVVAGTYGGHASPMAQTHAFTLLDVNLRSGVYFDVAAGHGTVVYVLAGFALALTGSHLVRLEPGQAFALHNPRGNGLLQLVGSGHVLVIDAPAASSTLRQGSEGARSGGAGVNPRTVRAESLLEPATAF